MTIVSTTRRKIVYSKKNSNSTNLNMVTNLALKGNILFVYHTRKNGVSFGGDSDWDIISRDLKSPIHMLDIHIVDSHSNSKTYN